MSLHEYIEKLDERFHACVDFEVKYLMKTETDELIREEILDSYLDIVEACTN